MLISFCLIFCQFQPDPVFKRVAYKKSIEMKDYRKSKDKFQQNNHPLTFCYDDFTILVPNHLIYERKINNVNTDDGNTNYDENRGYRSGFYAADSTHQYLV